MSLITQTAKEQVGKTRKGKQNRRPWFDREVKEEIGKRREINRQHRWAKRKGYPKAQVDYLWECFEEQKVRVKALVATKIEQFRRKTEEDILKGEKIEKFWRQITTMHAEKKKEHTPMLQRGGKDLKEKCEIEEWMTEYFLQQQQELKQSPEETYSQKETLGKRKIQKHSILEPITTGEMKRQIKQLKNRKATGMDDIPNEFLKALKKEAVDNLRACFNGI